MLGNSSSGSCAKGCGLSEEPASDTTSRRRQQFAKTEGQEGQATLEKLRKLSEGLSEAEEEIGLLDETGSLLETHLSVCDLKQEAGEARLECEPESEGEGELREVVLTGIAADDIVSLYLREMACEPLLSREEEVELAQRIERGDAAMQKLAAEELSSVERRGVEKQIEAAEEARARFIRANTRLVVSIANKYASRRVPFPDLIQEGNLGLIRAVEKFDYRRGHRFATYATWWIRQTISRALANQGCTIRIPIYIGARIRRIWQIAQQFEKREGRWPTSEEIAEQVGISPHEVRRLLGSFQQAISLQQPVDEEQDNELGYLIEDEELLTPPDATAQMLLAEEMNKVLGTLDRREEEILRLRYGLHDGRNYTLQEVGERLGLTRERIRQIEAQALRRLRHPRRSRSLRHYLW